MGTWGYYDDQSDPVQEVWFDLDQSAPRVRYKNFGS